MKELSSDDLVYGTTRHLLTFQGSGIGEDGYYNLQQVEGAGIMSMNAIGEADCEQCEEDLDNCLEGKEGLTVLLNECNDALGTCSADLLAANETISTLQGQVDALCDQQPPAGSWSANRAVFYSTSSGSCSSFKYYGHQFNTATLSQTLKFLGGSLGNGYPFVNTTATITALYQVEKPNGTEELPPNPVNSDGTFPCMFIYGNIQLKKYNPSTGLYGSSQAGIPYGANGIGEYGVFHGTNYAWSDGSTVNPYQIGTITKEASADEFLFNTINDPCAE